MFCGRMDIEATRLKYSTFYWFVEFGQNFTVDKTQQLTEKEHYLLLNYFPLDSNNHFQSSLKFFLYDKVGVGCICKVVHSLLSEIVNFLCKSGL